MSFYELNRKITILIKDGTNEKTLHRSRLLVEDTLINLSRHSSDTFTFEIETLTRMTRNTVNSDTTITVVEV